MELTPDQIAIVAGLIVSAVVGLLKKFWPAFVATTTLVKVATTFCGSVLAIGIAVHWQIDADFVKQIFVAFISAVGIYQVLGRPLVRGAIYESQQKETK